MKRGVNMNYIFGKIERLLSLQKTLSKGYGNEI